MAIKTCEVGQSVPNFFTSLVDGDIARFRQGTHNQGAQVTCDKHNVTFESTPGERATIIGTGGRMRFYGVNQKVQQLNLHQTGGPSDANEIEFARPFGKLYDCDLTNNFGHVDQTHAIKIYIGSGEGAASGFEGKRNFFHQIGRPGYEDGTKYNIFAHAYYLSRDSTDCVFEDEHFFEVLGGYCYHSYLQSLNARIRRAYAHNSYFMVAGAGTQGMWADSCAISWTRGTVQTPAAAGGATQASPVVGAIAARHSCDGSNCGQGILSRSATFTNAGSQQPDGIAEDPNLMVSTQNIVADPQFVNPSINNFTIQNSTVRDHLGLVVPGGPPAVPTGLVATASPDTFSIALTWNANAEANVSYQLLRWHNGAFDAFYSSAQPAYIETLVEAGETYCWQVRAQNLDGQVSAWTTLNAANSCATVIEEEPPVEAILRPTTFQAAAPTPNAVNLTWQDNADNETGHHIQRSLFTNFSGAIVIDVPGANIEAYTDNTVAPGTTYFYRARAYNATDVSEWSDQWGINVPSTVTVDAPSDLSAVATGPNSIDLTWTDNADNETAYQLWMSTDPSFPFGGNVVFFPLPADAESYSITGGLQPSTTYHFQVRCFNPQATSPFSAPDSATTQPGTTVTVAAPSGLDAVSAGANAINLTWTDNANNEATYQVEIATDSGFPAFASTYISLPPDTEAYAAIGLQPSTTYHFRVRCFNPQATSPWSSPDSAATGPGEPPPPPPPEEFADEQASATWTFWLCWGASLERIAPLNQARNRSLSLTLNRPGSATFTLPMTDEYADQIHPILTGIIAYRKGTAGNQAVWSGYVSTIDEDVSNNSMTVNCVGWLDRLAKRITRRKLTYKAVDDGAIILALLNEANLSTVPGDSYAIPTVSNASPHTPTWMQAGSALPNQGFGGPTSYVTSNRDKLYEKYTSIGPEIQALTELENGCDIDVHPLTRTLNVYRKRQIDRTEVQFGYNYGAMNISQFGRQLDSSTLVNYLIASGRPELKPRFADSTFTQIFYGIVEESISLTDAKNSDILQAYAGGEIIVRQNPRVTYALTPFPYTRGGRVPEPFVEYNVGDKVYFTARWGERINIIGQATRVFGMSFNIDEEGNERPGPIQLAPG